MRHLIALPYVGYLLLIIGCTTSFTSLEPGITLASVQRPAEVAERWGEYTLTEADTAGYSFSDEMVSIAVVATAGTLAMVIENLTDHTVRLLWEEMAYVSPVGTASGVVTGETRWIDMNNPPPPQVIPSRSRASVLAIPRENADVSARTIRGFFEDSATCSEALGSEFRLIVPLEIQGSVNEYTLTFTVDEADRVTYERDGLQGRTVEVGRSACEV